MKLQFAVAAENLPEEAFYSARISIGPNSITGSVSSTNNDDRRVVVIGATEICDTPSKSPVWERLITPASDDLPAQTPLVVEVLRSEEKHGNGDPAVAVVASTHFRLDEITEAFGQVVASFTSQAHDGGASIAIHAAPMTQGRLSLQLAARNLPNTDFNWSLGILRPKNLTDAFCEIYSASSGKQVARTNVVPDRLNPVWVPLELDIEQLCGTNKDAPVRITVKDQNKGDNVDYLGQVMVTLSEMENATPTQLFPLVKGGTNLPKAGLLIQKATLYPSTRVSRQAHKQLNMALLRINSQRDKLIETLRAQQGILEKAREEASKLQTVVQPLQVETKRLALVHNDAVARLAKLQEEHATKEHASRCHKVGSFVLRLRAEKLPDVDFGILNKSDPLYEIMLGDKILLTSNVVNNNLNPVWKEQRLRLEHVGDMQQPIRIVISDYDRGDRKTMLGSTTTTLQSLLDAMHNKSGMPLPPSKKGMLFVVKAETEIESSHADAKATKEASSYEKVIMEARDECVKASEAYQPVHAQLENALAAAAAAEENVEKARDAVDATKLALDGMESPQQKKERASVGTLGVHVAYILCVFFLACVVTPSLGHSVPEAEADMTVHASIDDAWPSHSLEAFQRSSLNFRQQRTYDNFMQGCYEALDEYTCNKNEKDRLAFNRIQPALMKNLTSTGYVKVETPNITHQILEDYINRFQNVLEVEEWGTQSLINHWSVAMAFHNMDFYMPWTDQQTIRRQVQDELEKWIGVPLTPTFMYGVRVYRPGAIIAPSVDRLPMVISAAVNVVQDEEEGEDWPLLVIGHDGVAVNLTLRPGQMILYEGHSVVHGRPYPLEKAYYANVYMHFEPIGYSYELKQNYRLALQDSLSPSGGLNSESAKSLFDLALQKQIRPTPKRVVTNNKYPAYAGLETADINRWTQNFIFHRDHQPDKPVATTVAAATTAAHRAAARGDLATLKREVEKDPSVLEEPDENGWHPIHEAARAGKTDVLEYLLSQGVNVNARTHQGKGASALWLAQKHGHHTSVELLKKHNAVSISSKDD